MLSSASLVQCERGVFKCAQAALNDHITHTRLSLFLSVPALIFLAPSPMGMKYKLLKVYFVCWGERKREKNVSIYVDESSFIDPGD